MIWCLESGITMCDGLKCCGGQIWRICQCGTSIVARQVYPELSSPIQGSSLGTHRTPPNLICIHFTWHVDIFPTAQEGTQQVIHRQGASSMEADAQSATRVIPKLKTSAGNPWILQNLTKRDNIETACSTKAFAYISLSIYTHTHIYI